MAHASSGAQISGGMQSKQRHPPETLIEHVSATHVHFKMLPPLKDTFRQLNVGPMAVDGTNKAVGVVSLAGQSPCDVDEAPPPAALLPPSALPCALSDPPPRVVSRRSSHPSPSTACATTASSPCAIPTFLSAACKCPLRLQLGANAQTQSATLHDTFAKGARPKCGGARAGINLDNPRREQPPETADGHLEKNVLLSTASQVILHELAQIFKET